MDGDRDLVAAHAVLAPRDVLVAERRALFAVAAELTGAGTGLPVDVLDDPGTRAALGASLAGRGTVDPSDLTSLDDLGARPLTVGAHTLRLAAGAAARDRLAPALAFVAAQAGAVDPRACALSLLLASNGRAFDDAAALVTAGVAEFRAADPALADDLLPHVALVALLAADTSGGLGSASAREYPGLILIPAPRSALEVAEALVHEGAHQKFFDLGVTRELLGTAAHSAPGYRPSWSPPAASWPFEQVFAAWHAYACLARFWGRLDAAAQAAVAEDSLLPVAEVRAGELGERLLGSGSHLARDAHALLAAVTGRRPEMPPDRRDVAPLPDLVGAGGKLVEHRAAGSGRRVVGRPGRPPEIFWVEEAGPLSELHPDAADP
jgi:HEXXH motif-containing protein